ncbi:hypothetical protein HY485_01510 [Candidatus Woesearchaeota archaeon]|nr:hypothetical protein [Candidatus Woesearchaeota archaeon]
MHKRAIALALSILLITLPIVFAQETAIPQQDTEAPEIKYFSIYPEITSLQPAQFSHQTVDYGVGRDSTICSGIKKVEFFDKETGKVLATRTGEQEDCVLEESFEYTPTQDGSFNICARAQDYSGKQSEEQCTKLTVVTKAPEPNKIEFFDTLGTITHTKKEGTTASMKLYFENTNALDLPQTLINVEKLTGIPSDWRNAFQSEDNTITVQDINVKTPFDCKITATIVDVFGNKATKDAQCSLTVDDEAPQTTTIITDLQDIEGAYLISTKELTTITARIDEKGTGFGRNKNVYLDLSEIIRNDKVQADECHKTNEHWECTWKITATEPKGGYTITLLSSSEDDAENNFAGEFKQDVDITDDDVEIQDIQYAPQNPTTDDEIAIMVSLPATISSPTVEIDASKISTQQTPLNAVCEKDGTALRCSARIKNLKATEGLQPVIITAKDNKGNTKQITQTIEIFATEPLVEDLFGFGNARIQPRNGIDKKTATITEYPIVATIFWAQKKTETDLSIIAQSINCDDKYLAETPQLTGEQSTRPTMFMKFSTDVSDIKEPALKIPCTAQLTIKKGNTLYQKPQKIEFTLKIPLYNNPLGTIEEGVQNKINDIEAQIKHLDNAIQDWEKTNAALGKLVSFGQTIAQTDAMMATVTSIIWGIAWFIWWCIVCGGPPAGQAVWAVYALPSLNFFYFPTKFVWTPSIIPYAPIKQAAFIYSCQLCKHSGSLQIPFLGGISNIITKIDKQEGKPTFTAGGMLYGWEPYKSIHVAQNCYCPPAIEYNIRKEQQITCIYRNCIKEHAKKGLPFAACDQTYKTQNCLYVDSAAWKIAGGSRLASLMKQMLGNFLSIGKLASSAAWTYACDPILHLEEYEISALALPGGWYYTSCALWGGAQELTETEFFSGNAFNWDQYDGDIKGHDYCGQIV